MSRNQTKPMDYWGNFKSKNTPNFKDWITKGADKNCIEWTKRFAEYITRKNDSQKDSNNNDVKDKNGKVLKRPPLTTTKLRKFYGALKKIEMSVRYKSNREIENASEKQPITDKAQIILVRLAYDVGREKDPHHKIVDFFNAVKELLNEVKDEKSFKNFIQILECIVAFVKVYENEIEIK